MFGVVVGSMEKFVMAEGSLAGAKVNCPGGSAFTTKGPGGVGRGNPILHETALCFAGNDDGITFNRCAV